MPGKISVRRKPAFLSLALLLALGGCASKSTQLRIKLEEGDYQEVIEEGTEWLGRTRAQEDAAERQWVDALVAEAHLFRVSASDRVADYQWLRRQYGSGARYASLLQAALKREAAAAWRDEAGPADDAAAYRRFRETYPDAEQVPEARKRELQRAFDQAQPTVVAQQAFRAHYDGWPELEALASASRGREVEAAFVAADVADDLGTWQRFREAYSAWPEAEGRLMLARDREAELALKEAEKVRALEALEAAPPSVCTSSTPVKSRHIEAALRVIFPLLHEDRIEGEKALGGVEAGWLSLHGQCVLYVIPELIVRADLQENGNDPERLWAARPLPSHYLKKDGHLEHFVAASRKWVDEVVEPNSYDPCGACEPWIRARLHLVRPHSEAWEALATSPKPLFGRHFRWSDRVVDLGLGRHGLVSIEGELFHQGVTMKELKLLEANGASLAVARTLPWGEDYGGMCASIDDRLGGPDPPCDVKPLEWPNQREETASIEVEDDGFVFVETTRRFLPATREAREESRRTTFRRIGGRWQPIRRNR